MAQLVRLQIRVASTDISKHLENMRLRPHVVLRLGFELIDKNHPAFARYGGRVQARAAYEKMVLERYPTTPEEAALPEDRRQGSVPDAVKEAIVQMRESSSDKRKRTSEKMQATLAHQ